MQSISVKELRQKFPVIKSELKKGESFIVIYKSRPIAELLPFSDFSRLESVTEEGKEVEMAALADMDDDYLNQEEVDYYLALDEYAA